MRRSGVRVTGCKKSEPVNSDQLELELDDDRPVRPWGGRSPRSLTKCGKLFKLSAIPPGGPDRVFTPDPDQYTLFLHGGKHG